MGIIAEVKICAVQKVQIILAKEKENNYIYIHFDCTSVENVQLLGGWICITCSCRG